jgi:hypothetical protein
LDGSEACRNGTGAAETYGEKKSMGIRGPNNLFVTRSRKGPTDRAFLGEDLGLLTVDD